MLAPIKVANELYNSYKQINKEIRNINKGGCGAFAEHLYHVLIRLGLKPTLGVITRNIKGMDERIKAWDKFSSDAEDIDYKHGYACVENVMVILNGKLIDSEGIYDDIKLHDDSYYHKMGICDTLTINVLKDWNDNGDFWNNSFDRNKIKLIEKRLNNCYKKVKKSLVVSK